MLVTVRPLGRRLFLSCNSSSLLGEGSPTLKKVSYPIEKLSDVQISASRKGTNTELIDTLLQKNASIDKSLQTSREDGSKEQSQEIRLPYHHRNRKNLYGQRQDQKTYKQYSSFKQRNYKFEKE